VVKTGDVIEFYNAVFIPAVKAFVLRLGSGKAALVRPPALSVPGTPARPVAGPGGGGGGTHHLFGTPPPAEAAAGASGHGAKFVSPGRACQVFISPLRESPQQVRRAGCLLCGEDMQEGRTKKRKSKTQKSREKRRKLHSSRRRRRVALACCVPHHHRRARLRCVDAALGRPRSLLCRCPHAMAAAPGRRFQGRLGRR